MNDQAVCQKDEESTIKVKSGGVRQEGMTQERVEMFHENGKGNNTEAKGVLIQTKRGEVPLMDTRLRIEPEDSMQWEKAKECMSIVKLEFKKKSTRQVANMGPGGKENQIWANDESSPLAFCFDKEKGWTAEALGLKVGIKSS